MRRLLAVVMLLCFAPSVAAAQDAEALRRELVEMQKRFETLQQEYQRAMQQLSERLQRLESPASTSPTPPGSGSSAPSETPRRAQTPATTVTPPSAVPAQPTLSELAQPRQPFTLSQQRGPGQLLFDIGVVGDFIANITQRNVDRADAGTFAGRENRVFPREIELNLFGQIDPYARGEVRIEAAEEFEGGERELHVGLAEAHVTLLTLPFGTQAKFGLMRNRFGLLNERHREALPQPDQPTVLTRFFGEEGLNESGLEATWVAPTPFYLQLIAGVFNGDNEDAFGRGSLKSPLLTGRLRTFFELGDTSALQLGVSAASGETEERRRNTVLGADAKYKFTPEGWRHSLVTAAAEALYGRRRTEVFDEEGLIGEDRTRRRFGWYTYAEVQPWRRWLFGARYDSTQYPVDPGREWAIEPYVAFMPSEFLRFRLGYKHTERSHRIAGTDDRGSGRVLDELFFQATFFLGAHPAHPF